MSGYVGDDSIKSIGNGLGADIIITGSLLRESPDSLSLEVKALEIETFTVKASFMASI
jgi:hypothetical protein